MYRSTFRADQPSAIIFGRISCTSSGLAEISGRIGPSIKLCSCIARFASSGSFKSRIVLITLAALFPTRLPISSLDKLNCAFSFAYAVASSIGFKSSRCAFSIIESSSLFCASSVRTIAGTVLSPANRDARHRRSPATI